MKNFFFHLAAHLIIHWLLIEMSGLVPETYETVVGGIQLVEAIFYVHFAYWWLGECCKFYEKLIARFITTKPKLE